MREHPWHLRRVTAEHQYKYRNLVDLHAMTRGWLIELGMERPSHVLPRGIQLSPDVASTLWMLETLGTEQSLAHLLDDTYPEDVLGRLEHAVWAVQAWTLSSILSKTGKSNRQATMNQLEQSSFKSGRTCCTSRWAKSDFEVNDLRALLSAFRTSPFFEISSSLVRRATSQEVQLELIHCPHHPRYPETLEVADELCALQAYWIRGYAYELQTRVVITHQKAEPRCQLHAQLSSEFGELAVPELPNLR